MFQTLQDGGHWPDIMLWAERVALLGTSMFTFYKLFLEKRKTDVELSEKKLQNLEKMLDFEDKRIDRMLERLAGADSRVSDLEEALAAKNGLLLELQRVNNSLKKTIDTDRELMQRSKAVQEKFRRHIRYLEKILQENNVEYEPFKE